MDHSRRKFLTQTLALGCSAAASPLVTPLSFAALPSDNRLVVIVLRGAMDGLDIVAPKGDRMLGQYRPKLIMQSHQDLDGFFALHPKMADLMPLWNAGELAFAHAVSTPYRDKRSHFDGQDLLEAGLETVSADLRETGWMNRLLSLMPGAEKNTAFSVGREGLLTLRGPFPTASWSPDGRIDLSPQAQLLLDMIYSKDPLFAEAGQTAMTLAAERQARQAMAEANAEIMVDLAANDKKARAAQMANGLARFAAARLKEETRLISFSIGGWDTHQRQDRSIKRAAKELQSALLTLRGQLGTIWAKTTVICVTEFGRTVRENGTGGTDHGTGGAMIMAGGAVRGGKVYGEWPGLAEADLYAGRDLRPSADLRRYIGWALHDLFGVSTSEVSKTVFPGVDMLGNPAFIL